MWPFSQIAREYRFLSGLLRTLRRVGKVDHSSTDLICDDFERAVDKFADHTAIIFEDQTATYRQLEALANRFAAWAEDQEIARGEAVAVFLPNRIEYVAAWMGLAKRGVVAALVNSNQTGAALLHSLSVSNAHHVITDMSSLEAFATLRAGMARPLTLWVIDASASAGPALARENACALDLKQPPLPPKRPDRSVRAGLTAGDTALYIYTSGTTGMPKAAKITHARAQLYMRGFAGATGTRATDRLYCALPLYHSTGGLCGVGAALFNGATLVLRRKFSASQFWDDVVEHECTIFVYIGELCRYLVNQAPHKLERAHHLRLAFGNGLRPEVWPEFQERFGVPHILEFYGSTEGNVSLFNFDERAGAVGRVPWYVRNAFAVRLIQFDIENEAPVRGANGFCLACKPGEVGEAVGLIRTEGARGEYAGYADQSATEKKILRDVFAPGDAWFRTGDLMRQDRDGYFYFVDRIGDTFRWKGENVSTTEVAEAISRFAGVAEVNVYGVKVQGQDGRAGMAEIAAKDGFAIGELARYLDAQLPAFARPLFVRMASAIDTTGTMKYRKVDLARDGFDPSKIETALYYLDPKAQMFKPLTAEVYAQIEDGSLRL